MSRRVILKGLTASALLRAFPVRAEARVALRVGICIPMTGAGFNAVGRQLASAIKLYVEQHGDVVAGRKIEIIMRDDGGVADTARRIVQEMIVNDKVNLIAIGITPTALAIAPLVSEAKIATLILSSGASITVTKSPYMVRAGFVLAPQSWSMAEWAAQNGSKRVVTLVNDWAPGIEAETAFTMRFKQAVDRSSRQSAFRSQIRILRRSFSASMISVRTPHSSTFPVRQAAAFAKQFAERGLGNSGIRIFGRGDLTDDDGLDMMGDQMVGIVTAGPYSAAHDSAMNKAYVASFEARNSFRPNFVSLGGYDGMHVLYEALTKTGGNSDGDNLIGVMKGMAWESPRGPMSIDPQTRDVVSNIYIRKIGKINGHLYNQSLRPLKP